MIMKFLQLAAGAVFLVLPVLANADGDPLEALEMERAKLEIERANLQLERENLQLERANVELERQNADRTVGSTSVSREVAPGTSGGQFYASNEALEFTYERYGPLPVFDNTRTTGSFIFSESRDLALIAGAFYDFQPDFLHGVELSFGVKAYAILLGIEDQDTISIGGAVEGLYRLPVENIPLPYIENFPLIVSAGLGVAPDILSFGNSDRIIDWFARVGIRATDTVDVFFGFRFLQVNTQPGDTEIDDRFHLGVKWKL